MMPTSASRDDWALHLARFANALRQDWDVPGIRAAIHAARTLGGCEDIAIALVELSKRRELKTPALLAQDGPHWHTGRTPDVRVTPARCKTHEHEWALNCRSCAVEKFDPTATPTLAITPEQAERNARGAALVRAALTGTQHHEAARTPAGPDARERAAGMDRDEETDR